MVEIDCWAFNKEGFISIAQSEWEKEQMANALNVKPIKAKLIIYNAKCPSCGKELPFTKTDLPVYCSVECSIKAAK